MFSNFLRLNGILKRIQDIDSFSPPPERSVRMQQMQLQQQMQQLQLRQQQLQQQLTLGCPRISFSLYTCIFGYVYNYIYMYVCMYICIYVYMLHQPPVFRLGEDQSKVLHWHQGSLVQGMPPRSFTEQRGDMGQYSSVYMDITNFNQQQSGFNQVNMIYWYITRIYWLYWGFLE